jgi:hypothetical protein
MKKITFISRILTIGLLASMLFTACEDNETIAPQQDLLPSSFRVDIPSSLSNQNSVINGRTSGRIKEDSLKGNDIYLHLNTFIAVGDGAASLVEEFIEGIRKHKIDRIQSLTYISEDDNRKKNLIVLSQATFENQTWDYQLTVTDADSEAAADGGKALQIFWNKSSTIKGIAIVKPYNCDRIQNAAINDAVFRIDYSEAGNSGYDAQMEVSISGLPLPSALEEPFAMSTLKMFVGKKGNMIDVYGNTNHPNAILFAGDTGFNWAFVASGNEAKNIAVAEVGLPPSELNSTNREVILKEYSIRNVFTNEITSAWPGIDQNILNAYLSNTAAPGYFNDSKGFISGGTSPGADWDALTDRIDDLSPYNPSLISNLVVSFK